MWTDSTAVLQLGIDTFYYIKGRTTNSPVKIRQMIILKQQDKGNGIYEVDMELLMNLFEPSRPQFEFSDGRIFKMGVELYKMTVTMMVDLNTGEVTYDNLQYSDFGTPRILEPESHFPDNHFVHTNGIYDNALRQIYVNIPVLFKQDMRFWNEKIEVK